MYSGSDGEGNSGHNVNFVLNAHFVHNVHFVHNLFPTCTRLMYSRLMCTGLVWSRCKRLGDTMCTGLVQSRHTRLEHRTSVVKLHSVHRTLVWSSCTSPRFRHSCTPRSNPPHWHNASTWEGKTLSFDVIFKKCSTLT